VALFLTWASSAHALGSVESLSKVPNDPDCKLALQLAERAIIEELPAGLTNVEVELIMKAQHRLVGIWYSDTNTCEAYDIIKLRVPNDRRSPHEILEEDILERMLRDGAITKYEAGGNGSFYKLFL
jgi:hypothetical protein